ncbi:MULTISPECIES: DUF948 domain-containing protein [unclassified Paenibacillus]|uniref:DUF948 domain-containing protein n=1 Tax=unclassified Paenibacillus TaxID=185978 RepID=UPI001AE8E290|nr:MULTISPECIES: DUF948 domain-containing protein [unclassified Paenibacillus]MBP1153907.1 uncharacterized protein YoxC [Paenibacillus sp. PvP091]MBP1170708.1 uncharacterized protein YoxC [Paenibacillus sp. PvR098]MBP2441736.1 uncharacterized protein YoxC [Paenibacillus sp. PvP052]
MDNMIITISVAVAAGAFVALVIFIIMTLRSVSELLVQTNTTIQEIQGQIQGISTEAAELLRHTNEVTMDVRNKLHSIDPVVYSVKNIGDAVQEVTSSLKQASATVADQIDMKVAKDNPRGSDAVVRIMQALPVVLDLWNSFRNRKKKLSPQEG